MKSVHLNHGSENFVRWQYRRIAHISHILFLLVVFYKDVGMPQYVLKGIQIWKWKIDALEPFEGGVVCGEDGGTEFKKEN